MHSCSNRITRGVPTTTSLAACCPCTRLVSPCKPCRFIAFSLLQSWLEEKLRLRFAELTPPRMASLKLNSGSTFHAQAQRGLPVRVYYRRSGTCKAPRKRLALLLLQKRSEQSVVSASAAVTGGDGPKGPANCYRSWGSGDGDFGNSRGDSYINITPVALGVLLAGMMVAAWQAGPPAATAASIADMAMGGVTEDYFQADRSLVQFHSSSAVTEDSDEYLCCGEGFIADEKELVVPKQYRVREWVFVH